MLLYLQVDNEKLFSSCQVLNSLIIKWSLSKHVFEQRTSTESQWTSVFLDRGFFPIFGQTVSIKIKTKDT